VFILLTLLVYSYAASRQAPWADSVRFLAVLYQVQGFAAGRLDLRHLTLHLSLSVFMLYLTVKVLQSRRNK
jgi:ABC-2 type transport system permease protein